MSKSVSQINLEKNIARREARTTRRAQVLDVLNDQTQGPIIDRYTLCANDEHVLKNVDQSVKAYYYKAVEQTGSVKPVAEPHTTKWRDRMIGYMMGYALYEPGCGLVAGRLDLLNLYEEMPCKSFYDSIRANTSIHSSLVEIVEKFHEKIEAEIVYDRDFEFDYPAMRTLRKTYFQKIFGKSAECPQWVFMRVALFLMGETQDLDADCQLHNAFQLYHRLSRKQFMLATPILMNAGTVNGQLSSCFLMEMDDSMDDITRSWRDSAFISKGGGGLGISMHNLRASGAPIRGTNGTSKGLINMIRVDNAIANSVDQSGKRRGSFSIYVPTWHLDVEDIINLRGSLGDLTKKCEDTFNAIWMSDLFVQRAIDDEKWTLFCPDEYPGLNDVYGKEFEELYTSYEQQAQEEPASDDPRHRVVRAREIFHKIFENHAASGSPYILYKDHINRKSNQSNFGIVKTSNLCTEITEATGETSRGKYLAVCNLGSLCLPQYLREDNTYDFDALGESVEFLTYVLNMVIIRTSYPSQSAHRSNTDTFPLGIGTQGFADVYLRMEIPYDSERCLRLTRDIYETIQYHAWSASCEMSERRMCGPYRHYEGSPISNGIFQHDMWNEHATEYWKSQGFGWVTEDLRCNWDHLRKRIKKNGVANSLLTAQMPTVGTSKIGSCYETMEPPTAMSMTSAALGGNFSIVNPYLVQKLKDLNLYSEGLMDRIAANDGSIQNIEEIPIRVRDLYKTAFEVKNRWIINHSAARGPFLDQSSSNTLYYHENRLSTARVFSTLVYAWRLGIKTGVYYTRVLNIAKAAHMKNLTPASAPTPPPAPKLSCTEDVCIMCSG